MTTGTGFTRLENPNSFSANKAVANLWQNKRDMVDPRNLNTIKEGNTSIKEPRKNHYLAQTASNLPLK